MKFTIALFCSLVAGNLFSSCGTEKAAIRLATYTYAENDRLENLRPLADVLEEQLKQPVQTISYPYVASFIDGIKKNQVDIALINTLGYLLLSLDNDHMKPVMALKVREDAKDNYKTVLLTNNSDIVNLEDLQEKASDLSMLFVAEGSTSGNLVPRLLLSSLGIRSPKDRFQAVGYGGNHTSTLKKLMNGDADICAIGSNEYFKQIKADSSVRSSTRLLWISDEIPLGPVLLNNNLGREMQARIIEAFVGLHQTNPLALSSLKAGWSEAKQADQFYPVADKDYDNFRNVNGNKTDLAEILALFTR